MSEEIQQHHLTNGEMLPYSNACNLMGQCYRQMGRLHESLEQYTKAIGILDNHDGSVNNVRLASVLQNAGNCASTMADYELALQYMRRALQINLDNNMHAGNTYCTIASCYKSLGQADLALEYYQRGIKELRLAGDKSGEAVYLNNVAVIYKEQKQYSKSRTSLSELCFHSYIVKTVHSINASHSEIMVLSSRLWAI